MSAGRMGGAAGASLRPLPVRVRGTGAYVPSRVVDSREFDRRWRKEDGWTERHSGVRERRVAGPGDSSSFMAAEAAASALAASGLDARELDCIVSASSVMEQAIPCLASQVQFRLGIGDSGVPAFDVNATCLSFLVALEQVACAVAVGKYRRVLVVSSEMPSIGLDPDDKATAPLFGDGAAAAVLESVDSEDGSGLLASSVRTYGEGGDHCRFRAGGTTYWRDKIDPQRSAGADRACFEMDGRALYRLATRHFPGFFSRLLELAGLDEEGLDVVIPHQASGKAIDWLQAHLGPAAGRIVRILPTRGNQVAASLPSALHEAVASGRLRRGDTVALLGTGAGLSIGGAILRY